MKQEVEAFLDYISTQRGRSPNTVAAYRNDLHQLVDFARWKSGKQDPSLKLVKEDHYFLSSYVLDLRKRDYTAATRARKLSAVKSWFKFLIAKGVIKSFPSEDLVSPKVNKAMPHFLSPAQIQAVLKQPEKYPTPEGKRDKAMLELLYSTGMQVAELLSLNVKDVNLTDHYVHCPGKGSKERIIPICGEAVQSLHKYLAEGRSQLALYNREEALFLNRFGKRLSRQGLWQILKGHAKAANLTAEITPRTIRHSFAARLISEGADLHTVQQRLGHVSSATTQAYSRFINKR